MRCAHGMPFGPALEPGGVRFRLWAPDCGDVAVHVAGLGDVAMDKDGDGWAEAWVPGIGAGARYGFRVGGLVVPDPASRHQPDDVHALSEVIDPADHDWIDGAWRGRPWEEAAIYELHVGTFTPAGTFRAVIDRLDHLAGLGVTAVELMPVAEFPGARGWGYDGVLPFAPEASYGRPEDLKALVEAAHQRGLMMFLDVVYNHFGPEGNYLHATARRFFTDRHHTPWGQAINYDGADSAPVREFVIHNALYWLEEFNFDGLRLDAVHAIVDDSRPSLLEELAERARAALPDRPIHLVLENDDNAARLLARQPDGRPRFYTAQWNDDIHHALHRLLTGEAGGYYRDYGADPLPHLCRCLAEGFAYQGEDSEHRDGARRGEPSAGLPPTAFVSFLQNHDQIGNRALGERLDRLAPEPAVAAATALMLLAPPPPLLFQGEEWGASTPFQYFCDFGPELARAVRRGRRREFAHFPQFQGKGAARIPDPVAKATFARSRLDWDERAKPPHARRLAQVRELLHIRGRQIAPRLAGARSEGCRGLGRHALEGRWRMGDGSLLTVQANLSDQGLAGPVHADGRLLYSTREGGGALPAWGVDWYLDDGGNA
ncbi:malto-oligosyltrehalose trehalohydrolase [Magnetospirillum sp. UT-4]|uniref:malto-oligosyltrehalose trehalohydrolase n=1 Tax=Magnetospirillum sp. UT-4 TaxID=2681467 RepID=UPI00137E37EB|nr:malto-oligosyltrehalose trehalohydrolase [Magnetospirillum sp. UT-4]CAA7619815.1 Malto-oligosyltrehalose trehalohydrolase [Magnetospirillum sp. UT-4]